MTRPLSLALVAALALLTLGACDKPQDAAFGNRVRTYLLAHPEVLEEMVQKLDEKKKLQAASTAKAAIDANRQALERDPRDFVANPGGKITVVEFYDYYCGYCKLAAPEVLALIAENPDIRFVFKELPVVTAQSAAPARIILSPAARGKTLELHRDLMAAKGLDSAVTDRILRAVGIDPAAARKGGNSDAVTQHISDNVALSHKIGVGGTPAFVVGNRLIEGGDIPAIRAAIAEARSGKLKSINSVQVAR